MTTLTTPGGVPTAPSEQNDAVDGASSNNSNAQEWILVERGGRPMATDVSVQIAAPPAQRAEAEGAADACMAWFDEVDLRLSRFRPESELSRLNATAGEWVAVSDVLYECTEVALAAAESSGGLFDPTLLRQLCDLGYDRDFAAIAHREVSRIDGQSARAATQAHAERAAWRAIALDSRHKRVQLPAGAQLDFGGIAKGWSADVALARYCGTVPGALINVGGDLRAKGGPQPGKLWAVGIRDPRLELAGQHDPATDLATAVLSRGAMATSGAVRRWWLRDGKRQHHLLDPRSGQPIPLWIDDRDGYCDGHDEQRSLPLIATATAFAPTAAQAEVAAKVALLRGYPLAFSVIEAAWERYGALAPANDADVGVALVLAFGNGAIRFSKNLASYLASWGTEGAPLPLVVRSALPYLSLSDFRQLEPSS